MSKLIRYGRVPADELAGHFQQGQEGGTVDPQNAHDRIFADKLADAEDPREYIVRRDLEHREDPDGFANSIDDHARSLAGGTYTEGHTDFHDLKDGTRLQVRENVRPRNYGQKHKNVSSYYIEWNHPDYVHSYAGIFTPNQHNHIMSKLGLTPEEPEQMQRKLIVSYDRNPRRYSLKKYAIKKPIARLPVSAGSLERNTPIKELNKPIASHVSIPVHKLVHTAMLDAANEAGLIPHDQPGQEQYKTFAKYSGLAHEELQNPDSPFTKLFNRHKSQIGSVDNPREHLKGALTPLFKYLAKHGEEGKLPLAEPHHEEGESEPIDLLHSGYHPFEVQGDDGSLHFVPRVPSGFVEVPPKAPKRKAYPNRNDVYKSIAEHADMGWSAPAKLADYIAQKHGITPQEAATHIRNFNRRQNKPTAPTPTPTKRVWPPVARKSRKYDPTDLMAILPKKYMRIGNPQEHDHFMSGIVRNHDESGLGPFADFLDEQGAPGGDLAREAYHNSIGERVSPPFQENMWFPGHDWNAAGTPEFYNEEGEPNRGSDAAPDNQISIRPRISRPYDVGGHRTGILDVIHAPQSNNYTEANGYLTYHVPVESKKHLQELTHNLPEPMRNRLWQTMAHHLRDTHEEPQQMGRKRYAKPGSTGASVQVTAKGEPYTATKNAQGYGIVPNGNPINRVSRSYQVYCDDNGKPISCSCPDHLYRHRVCKHMEAIASIGKGGDEPKKDDDAVKLSAYKSPKGGVIVRGTQYKGGNMIPDMESKFMSPRRRMFNRIKRYGQAEDRKGFISQIAKNPKDLTTRKVFADWLDDHEPTAHPTHVDRLRNYDGPLHITLSPKGQVLAIPHVTKELLEKRAAENKSLGPFFHITSKNRKGQAHSVRVSGKMQTWKRDPERFRVPWKFGMYDNGEVNQDNMHEWLTEDPTGEP